MVAVFGDFILDGTIMDGVRNVSQILIISKLCLYLWLLPVVVAMIGCADEADWTQLAASIAAWLAHPGVLLQLLLDLLHHELALRHERVILSILDHLDSGRVVTGDRGRLSLSIVLVAKESDGLGLQLVQWNHNLNCLLWLLLDFICCSAAEDGLRNLDCVVHPDETDRFVGFGYLAATSRPDLYSSLVARAQLVGSCRLIAVL